MSSSIQKLYHKKSYEKLYKIIQANNAKDLNTSTQYNKNDINVLRSLIQESVLDLLHKDAPIPKEIILLIFSLGTSYTETIKSMITGYIVSQKTADIGQHISLVFRDPTSIAVLYKYIEKIISETSDKYHVLPENWGIELSILTHSIFLLKQKICEFFFSSTPSGSMIGDAILLAIDMENSFQQFLIEKNCCILHTDKITENLIIHDCIHQKMISSIFLPYIEQYFYHILSTNTTFSLKVNNLHIIEGFLHLFSRVEHLYTIIEYFKSQSAVMFLLKAVDTSFISSFRLISTDSSLSRANVIFCSIIYVQDTLQDLLEKIQKEYSIDHHLQIFQVLIDLEKRQQLQLEEHIEKHFEKSRIFSRNLSTEPALLLLKESVLSDSIISKHLKNLYADFVMGSLFSRIRHIPMNILRAESLLTDITMIDEKLKSHSVMSQNAHIIKEYLKIFICSTEPQSKFIENFIVLGENLFSFTQILNGLEDQSRNRELFLSYKRYPRLSTERKKDILL